MTTPVPAAAKQLVLGTMYLIVSQNLLLDLKQDFNSLRTGKDLTRLFLFVLL